MKLNWSKLDPKTLCSSMVCDDLKITGGFLDHFWAKIANSEINVISSLLCEESFCNLLFWLSTLVNGSNTPMENICTIGTRMQNTQKRTLNLWDLLGQRKVDRCILMTTNQFTRFMPGSLKQLRIFLLYTFITLYIFIVRMWRCCPQTPPRRHPRSLPRRQTLCGRGRKGEEMVEKDGKDIYLW